MLRKIRRINMAAETVVPDLFAQLLSKYWWMLLIPAIPPLIKMFAPLIKGRIGEGVTNLAAKLRLDPNVYHLIKDVTVPSKTGTTQIDHVIVSKFGLFVIETKNFKGWIFANAKDAKWTQVNFKQKHRFQNPLRQNYAHICALSELLELPKDKIIGVVCFMGDAKFKTEIPSGVFLDGRYVNYVQSFQTPVFSEAEVADMIQKIESGRLERGFKTNRQHIWQLKDRHSTGGRRSVAAGSDGAEPSQIIAIEAAPSKNDFVSDPKTCPKCGAAMVLRTAKKGANAGNQFWGCSRYPDCRTILPFH